MIVFNVCKLALADANSPIARNLAYMYMRHVHNIDFHINLSHNIANALEQQGLITNLNDLIAARKGIKYIDNFNNDMLETMLKCVACY